MLRLNVLGIVRVPPTPVNEHLPFGNKLAQGVSYSLGQILA